jgi:hypothetical protein
MVWWNAFVINLTFIIIISSKSHTYIYIYDLSMLIIENILFLNIFFYSVCSVSRKWNDYRVVDLKKECDKRGLSKSGNKQEIVERLRTVIVSHLNLSLSTAPVPQHPPLLLLDVGCIIRLFPWIVNKESILIIRFKNNY